MVSRSPQSGMRMVKRSVLLRSNSCLPCARGTTTTTTTTTTAFAGGKPRATNPFARPQLQRAPTPGQTCARPGQSCPSPGTRWWRRCRPQTCRRCTPPRRSRWAQPPRACGTTGQSAPRRRAAGCAHHVHALVCATPCMGRQGSRRTWAAAPGPARPWCLGAPRRRAAGHAAARRWSPAQQRWQRTLPCISARPRPPLFRLEQASWERCERGVRAQRASVCAWRAHHGGDGDALLGHPVAELEGPLALRGQLRHHQAVQVPRVQHARVLQPDARLHATPGGAAPHTKRARAPSQCPPPNKDDPGAAACSVRKDSARAACGLPAPPRRAQAGAACTARSARRTCVSSSSCSSDDTRNSSVAPRSNMALFCAIDPHARCAEHAAQHSPWTLTTRCGVSHPWAWRHARLLLPSQGRRGGGLRRPTLTCAKLGRHFLPAASVSSSRTVASVPAPILSDVRNTSRYWSPATLGCPGAGAAAPELAQPRAGTHSARACLRPQTAQQPLSFPF